MINALTNRWLHQTIWNKLEATISNVPFLYLQVPINYLWVFHCNLLSAISRLIMCLRLWRPYSSFKLTFDFEVLVFNFWLSVELDLLPLQGLIMMWRHFLTMLIFYFANFSGQTIKFWLHPNIIDISCYWITFEITSNSLRWTYGLIHIFNLYKSLKRF